MRFKQSISIQFSGLKIEAEQTEVNARLLYHTKSTWLCRQCSVISVMFFPHLCTISSALPQAATFASGEQPASSPYTDVARCDVLVPVPCYSPEAFQNAQCGMIMCHATRLLIIPHYVSQGMKMNEIYQQAS